MSDLVKSELEDGIAQISFDDGKANALSPAMIDALNAALDRAEQEADAIVLEGRPGRFCAGFDLSVMGQGGEVTRNLVAAGAELCLRLLDSPRPIVAACTGHAMAGGAVMLLSCDTRIGVEGAFKIGLNEVAIGMTLPHFGREIAKLRLSKRHLLRAAVQAETYGPELAVDAGFLDALAPADELLDTARQHAKALARLDARAFVQTRRGLFGSCLQEIRDELRPDLARMIPG